MKHYQAGILGLVVTTVVFFTIVGTKYTRGQIIVTPIEVVEEIIEEPIEEIKHKRHQFVICREKLYTKYPNKMNQSEWRNCMVT
tara:strand:- start:224 stop:475 length:252 start_codon:yes stop_codon:yes gene_type:complete